jgi:CheY-like chemotaxis protein
MRRVLVVDDESSMRFLLKIVFESAGYEVVEAHHGAVALDLVKDHRPAVVVTDLMMPVMDGHHLIACLRSDPETASIPIIATSASLAASSSAADAVLTKPFDADRLLETARSLVEGGD